MCYETFYKIKTVRSVWSSVIAVRDLLDKQKVAKKFGVVEVDSENKILGFEEKPENPKTTLAATLIYMLDKNAVNKLLQVKDKKTGANAGDFIIELCNEQNVYSFVFKERWYDIGNKEELEEVNKTYF